MVPTKTGARSTYTPLARCRYAPDLVKLTSRFEATRGLFWDGPHHFEDDQMTRTILESVSPPPKFYTTPAAGCLTFGGFNVTRLAYTVDIL
ncbi:hypothetical protein AVEN_178144-1 [Araneus ventricosus]|uniref:Uncharacterized protein n=1 Tax=Araneus ventricosus TaxID=182803 RepID=A0A4Y2GDT1_ARAVE|nr:hypothetical protein AVEN_178144-1 [Araneus ventricosus]